MTKGTSWSQKGNVLENSVESEMDMLAVEVSPRCSEIRYTCGSFGGSFCAFRFKNGHRPLWAETLGFQFDFNFQAESLWRFPLHPQVDLKSTELEAGPDGPETPGAEGGRPRPYAGRVETGTGLERADSVAQRSATGGWMAVAGGHAQRSGDPGFCRGGRAVVSGGRGSRRVTTWGWLSVKAAGVKANRPTRLPAPSARLPLLGPPAPATVLGPRDARRVLRPLRASLNAGPPSAPGPRDELGPQAQAFHPPSHIYT